MPADGGVEPRFFRDMSEVREVGDDGEEDSAVDI